MMKSGEGSIFIAAAVLTSILWFNSNLSAYSGGTGEPNNPYQIANKDDLLALAADANDYGKSFILTTDINMEGQVFTTAIIAADTSSDSGFQGTTFTGAFDGNGHKIANFTIDGGSNDHLGLFGEIDGGSIKNLGLENCVVSGTSDSYNVGCLVGWNIGIVSNCYSTGTVNGFSYIGGLVGFNRGSISDCYSTGTVSGSYNVGGLVGLNGGDSGDEISNCYSTCTVNGFSSIGGLVGANSGSISNCYSMGEASGSNPGASVGGLVGFSQGIISRCYSTGAVNGSGYIGGLAGINVGSVNGSFWDKDASGRTTSAGGTGLSTLQMKQQTSFTGWDFTNETVNDINDYWRMCVDGVDYPRLNWESIAGDFACPDGVTMEDLSYFVQRWIESNCTSSNNYCGGVDTNVSGTVDFTDFAILAANWLEGF